MSFQLTYVGIVIRIISILALTTLVLPTMIREAKIEDGIEFVRKALLVFGIINILGTGFIVYLTFLRLAFNNMGPILDIISIFNSLLVAINCVILVLIYKKR